MRYRVGSRVHYRVYPSGLPATGVVGTVTDVGRHPTRAARLTYSVMWDDVDAGRFKPTPGYMAHDLAPIACDACSAGAGERCRPDCIGAAADVDATGGR